MKDDFLVIKSKRLKGDDGYKVFSIRIKEGLVERLEQMSAQSGYSRNELISILLEYALDRSIVETSADSEN